MANKIVIVGGVAGGATAAARIRRLDEYAEITVFERSGYISYANCGLPYYIGGVIEDQEELTLQTPESFFTRFRTDMKVHHEVLAINSEKKTVLVRNLDDGTEWEEPYDKLLLSPGARPVMPDIPGTDLDRVHVLRTVEDTVAIRNQIEKDNVKSVLISGGGFIGLELAENLIHRGIEVIMLQRSNQVMNPLDPEMASFLHSKIRKSGIKLYLEESVEELQLNESGTGISAKLKKGGTTNVDMVVLAIGVMPETTLAKEAGLALGIKGSIIVNERMETSIPDIYAVGDAVQVKQYTTGEDAVISLAGPANRQGRIAADNICGLDSTYPGSQGSSVFKMFDTTIAMTGINEKTAKSEGLDYSKVYLSPQNHAGYYPGGSIMTMKVIFENGTNRLLGAQIIGKDGVDKRIDVLATAMYAKIPGDKLKELDLAYAPPYSSAKDPVNMAGFMIENISKGILKQFFFDDIPSLPKDGSVTLLDTRTVEEYEGGHVDGFMNIPVDELRDRMSEIDKDKPVYVMCQSGLRSYIACSILRNKGYDCYNFSGGYRLYQSIALDQEVAEQALPCGMDK